MLNNWSWFRGRQDDPKTDPGLGAGAPAPPSRHRPDPEALEAARKQNAEAKKRAREQIASLAEVFASIGTDG
jgi:hypothetical protein